MANCGGSILGVGVGELSKGWGVGSGGGGLEEEQHQGRAETAPLSTIYPLQGQEEQSSGSWGDVIVIHPFSPVPVLQSQHLPAPPFY